MPGSDTMSQLFGYASIACWLGAQLPQILENSRLQSCDGLSLPFLLNWYLGDCCNLLGCILTNQLPFQTLLASYFVCVDTTLLFQYFYYNTRPAKPYILPRHSHERTLSASRATIRAERTPSRYRTISAVAANVAAAAALAARHDEQGHTRRHPCHQRTATDISQNNGTFQEEEEEGVPPKMMESFHSECGHPSGQKRVSWSIERHRPRGTSLRSRSLLVSPDYSAQPAPNDHDHAAEPTPSPTLSLRRSSRSRKRGASLVFLGIWALFGIGGYTTGGKMAPEPDHHQSVSRVVGISTISATGVPSAAFLQNFSHDTPLPPSSEILITLDKRQDRIERDFPRSTAGNNRFLGRIFAWLCTILYLTSRLPQIWKNYVRKSVDGLAISLFICAFLGNVFYVSSIVISTRFHLPAPLSTDYIRESVPYLLGSGGTLMFDITIVTQFFLYRRNQRHSLLGESLPSEETALLSGGQQQYLISEHPPRGRTSQIKVAEP